MKIHRYRKSSQRGIATSELVLLTAIFMVSTVGVLVSVSTTLRSKIAGTNTVLDGSHSDTVSAMSSFTPAADPHEQVNAVSYSSRSTPAVLSTVQPDRPAVGITTRPASVRAVATANTGNGGTTVRLTTASTAPTSPSRADDGTPDRKVKTILRSPGKAFASVFAWTIAVIAGAIVIGTLFFIFSGLAHAVTSRKSLWRDKA